MHSPVAAAAETVLTTLSRKLAVERDNATAIGVLLDCVAAVGAEEPAQAPRSAQSPAPAAPPMRETEIFARASSVAALLTARSAMSAASTPRSAIESARAPGPKPADRSSGDKAGGPAPAASDVASQAELVVEAALRLRDLIGESSAEAVALCESAMIVLRD
jgi:hypothetical protein